MANMTKTLGKFEFTIDNELNIIKSDSAFKKHICKNTDNFSIVLNETDKKHLLSTLKKLEPTTSTHVVYRITVDMHSTYSLVYIENINNLYRCTAYNIETMGERLNLLNFLNKRKNAILACYNINYFIYNVVDKMILVSSTQIDDNADEFHIDLFETRFNSLLKISLSEEDQQTLLNLEDDLLNHEINKKYTFLDIKGSKIKIVTRPLYDEQENLTHIVGVVDTKENPLDLYETKSNKLDGLTGLLNKKSIIDYAQNRMDLSKTPAALFIIDIDNFKLVNDNFGHAFGDVVIKDVANVIKEAVGKAGRVGRFGGDEYVVILENTNDEEVIRNSARKIRQGIQALYIDKSPNLMVTCSIGIARYPMNSENFEETFDLADKALYYSKLKGKNKYIIYKPELHEEAFNNNGKVGKDRDEFFNAALNQSEIISSLSTRSLKNLDKALENTIKLLEISNICFLNKKFEIMKEFGGKTETEWRKNLLSQDKYLRFFNTHNVFVNNNISNFEGINSRLLKIYKDKNIASSLEILCEDQMSDIGLVCYEKYDYAKTWSDSEITFIIILTKLVLEIFKKQ